LRKSWNELGHTEPPQPVLLPTYELFFFVEKSADMNWSTFLLQTCIKLNGPFLSETGDSNFFFSRKKCLRISIPNPKIQLLFDHFIYFLKIKDCTYFFLENSEAKCDIFLSFSSERRFYLPSY
jgi:hypothetical protein